MSIKKLEAFLTLREHLLADKGSTLDKYQQDSEFAQQIDTLFQILSEPDAKGSSPSQKRRSRRNPGILNPLDLYHQGGVEGLRQQLKTLNVEQLKDIIAEQGLDSSRRAMTWKKPERLIELIVQRVKNRDRQGNAFR